MWITELYEKQDHAATEHAKNQEIILKKMLTDGVSFELLDAAS